MSTEVLAGAEVGRAMADPALRAAWDQLWADCPFATSFTEREWVALWYAAQDAEPILVLERQGETLEGLLAAARTGDVLVPAGGDDAPTSGWLSRPLIGSWFVERAIEALQRHAPAGELRLRALAPGAPDDWVRPARRLGALARARNVDRCILTLDSARAAEKLEKKANTAQLARLRRAGNIELVAREREGLEALLERASKWHAASATDRGLAREGAPSLGSRAHLAALGRAGRAQISTLYAGDEIASCFVVHRDGDRAYVVLGAEPPQMEPASPSIVHFFLLEELWLSEGIRRVDVTAGPSWMRLYAAPERAVEWTIHWNRAARLRHDAQARLKDLGRWAIAKADGRRPD